MAVAHFNLVTFALFYALIVGLATVIHAAITMPRILELHQNETNVNVTNGTEHHRNHLIQRSRDWILIQRNAVPLIIIFTALVQGCISSILFTKKHDYFAHIFCFLQR